MPLKSSSDQYGSFAVIIHWVSALLVLVLLATGFRAGGTEDSAAILRLHVPLGLTILILTLARIAWWMLADTKPASAPMPAWQDRISRIVHVLLYVVILGMAASGMGMLILSGAVPVIFGATKAAMPDFWDYLPRVPHGIGGRVLVALLVLHAGAALYHHFFQRDHLLRRMWFASEK